MRWNQPEKGVQYAYAQSWTQPEHPERLLGFFKPSWHVDDYNYWMIDSEELKANPETMVQVWTPEPQIEGLCPHAAMTVKEFQELLKSGAIEPRPHKAVVKWLDRCSIKID